MSEIAKHTVQMVRTGCRHWKLPEHAQEDDRLKVIFFLGQMTFNSRSIKFKKKKKILPALNSSYFFYFTFTDTAYMAVLVSNPCCCTWYLASAASSACWMKHFCLTVLFAADSGGEGEVTSASRDLGEAESPYRRCHPDLTRGPAGHPSQAHHALTSNPAGCNTNPQLKLVLKFWVGGLGGSPPSRFPR